MSKQITLSEALLAYKQADEEGVMVLVSRQAIHEAVERIVELEQETIDAGAECYAAGMKAGLEESGYQRGLEDAAKVCDELAKLKLANPMGFSVKWAEWCAEAIRGLKNGETPTECAAEIRALKEASHE